MNYEPEQIGTTTKDEQKTQTLLRSAVKRLFMFNGKYSFCVGLFWMWAVFFMSEGRETFACLGAAVGWLGYSLEENRRRT